MANIIGVKFSSRGKLVHCDAGEIPLQVNDYVVVDTDNGPELAKVATLEDPYQPGEQLMKIVRKAEGKDLEEARRNLEEEALVRCHEMVGQLGLKMKPLGSL